MTLATFDDAMREYARNVGWHDGNINSQWLLTDHDVWVRNPHYTGPEQRHPEDDSDDHWEESDWEESDWEESDWEESDWEESDDGQPSEAQEWHDFDPEC